MKMNFYLATQFCNACIFGVVPRALKTVYVIKIEQAAQQCEITLARSRRRRVCHLCNSSPSPCNDGITNTLPTGNAYNKTQSNVGSETHDERGDDVLLRTL